MHTNHLKRKAIVPISFRNDGFSLSCETLKLFLGNQFDCQPAAYRQGDAFFEVSVQKLIIV